jgi:NAD(P)-dependent dehydrogenase (short-subunit alcohol dehydrogenase family)
MLKGKTALVTGSTSGIGLGIAKALAKQGANIVLNGFGDHAGPEAEIAALGAQVVYHGADMSKPAEIEAMVKFAEEKFGSVDILVNNAGIQHVARVENFPVERWDAVIAINLSSAFHASRAVLPAMQKANWGPHHQCGIGSWLGGFCRKISLCSGQARHCGLDQSHGPRKCHLWRDMQCDLPRLGVNALGSKTSGRQSSGTGLEQPSRN